MGFTGDDSVSQENASNERQNLPIRGNQAKAYQFSFRTTGIRNNDNQNNNNLFMRNCRRNLVSSFNNNSQQQRSSAQSVPNFNSEPRISVTNGMPGPSGVPPVGRPIRRAGLNTAFNINHPHLNLTEAGFRRLRSGGIPSIYDYRHHVHNFGHPTQSRHRPISSAGASVGTGSAAYYSQQHMGNMYPPESGYRNRNTQIPEITQQFANMHISENGYENYHYANFGYADPNFQYNNFEINDTQLHTGQNQISIYPAGCGGTTTIGGTTYYPQQRICPFPLGQQATFMVSYVPETQQWTVMPLYSEPYPYDANPAHGPGNRQCPP